MKKFQLYILFCFIGYFGAGQNDSIEIKTLLDKGYEYESDHPDSALATYNKAYEKAIKNKLFLLAGKSVQYKGIVYSDLAKYDASLRYYNQAKSLFSQNNYPKEVADIYINIGNVYKQTGDYEAAAENYLEGIKRYEKEHENTRQLIALGNLATVFEVLGQFEKAKSSYLKSNTIATRVRDSTQLIYNHYNLSNLYFRAHKNDSILTNIEKAEAYLSPTSEPFLHFLVEHGKSQYYLNIKDYANSIGHINIAIDLINGIGNPHYIASSYLILGKNQLHQNQLNLAEKNAQVALKTAHKNKEVLMRSYSLLSDIYKAMHNGNKALDYKELEFKYYDSILGDKQRSTVSNLNIKYETEKKDKQIAEKQLQLEQQELEIQKRRTQYSVMTGIAIILMLATLSGWLIYLQRQKRKNQEILTLKREQQVKTLESLREGEEKERFRIAKELHDGVNGDLSAIKYKLTSMLAHNTTVVNEVVAMIDKSSEQVRAISHNLVPPSLEKFNLIEALEDYCVTMNEVHEPQVSFQHIGEEIPLSKNTEINVYRIVQELVSNSIKHSGGSKITVQTSHRPDTILITVEDNGTGFDPNKVLSKGIGLKNIDSRIDYLNATKDFISNSKGTSYTIGIDLNKLNDN